MARLNSCAPSLLSQLVHQYRSKLASNFISGQPLANLSADQINAHKIMPTLRNNYVCKTLRRLDELHVHRPHRRDVLVDYRIKRAPALGDIAAQTADETKIVRRIDEDFDGHLLEQPWLGEYQNPLDDDDGFRRNAGRGRQARMRFEIVNWKLNRLAGVKLLQMIDEQFVIDGIRVIKVRRVAIIERHIF